MLEPDLSAIRRFLAEHERSSADEQEYLPSGRLIYPENQAIIKAHMDEFRSELQHWRLNKDDPLSPTLGKELMELLVQRCNDMIIYFDKAATFPIEREGLKKIIRMSQPLRLEQELYQAAAIMNYQGDKTEAVVNLLGTTIKRAIDASMEIGLLPSTDRRFFRGFDSETACRLR